MFDPRLHHRRSVRLQHHDYASNGAYFITVCSANKRSIFGKILHGEMRLNWVGEIVARQWRKSELLREEITLDNWQIMPNHFHAIIWINNRAAPVGNVSTSPIAPRSTRSISSLMAHFKAAVTREFNQFRATQGKSPVDVWQRSFYDRYIRDETELEKIRCYIIENPIHWEHDEYA